MSRLLKYQKKNIISQPEPVWLSTSSPVQKRLYWEAKKQFEEKKTAIESGKASHGKASRMVASEIASAAKCDKSNISKRKNPDLHKWINDLTEELIALAQSNGLSKVSRRKSTEEVRQENQQFRQQLKAERNYDYVAIAEALLANTLTESHKNISDELAELRQANRLLISSINLGHKNS